MEYVAEVGDVLGQIREREALFFPILFAAHSHPSVEVERKLYCDDGSKRHEKFVASSFPMISLNEHHQQQHQTNSLLVSCFVMRLNVGVHGTNAIPMHAMTNNLHVENVSAGVQSYHILVTATHKAQCVQCQFKFGRNPHKHGGHFFCDVFPYELYGQ